MEYDPIYDADAAVSEPIYIDVMGLYTYPIKSCAGVRLEEAEITPRGIKHDRDYMLVDDNGNYVTQQQIPELALIVPKIGHSALTLSAPGIDDLEFPLQMEPDNDRLMWTALNKKPVCGQIVSDEVNAWFTDCLSRYKDSQAYRLIKVREDKPRNIGELYQKEGVSNKVGFAYAHAILLASNTSLAQLNADIDQAVEMDRFRPNIVVDGEYLEPYDEDFWLKVQIGQLSAFVVKACDRCAVVDIDQRTAETTGKAVRQGLASSRRGENAYDSKNKGVFFAQNLSHVYVPGTKIYFNDSLKVLERRTERNLILKTPHVNKIDGSLAA